MARPRAHARFSLGHSGQPGAATCPAVDCERYCNVQLEALRGLREPPPWWVCRCPPCECEDCLGRAHRARVGQAAPLEAPIQLQFGLEEAA